MKEPITVRIEVIDADGVPIQKVEQYQLDKDTLVYVQEALSNALVGLGKAGIELRKNPK